MDYFILAKEYLRRRRRLFVRYYIKLSKIVRGIVKPLPIHKCIKLPFQKIVIPL